ncbi:MAG: hypothetical protein QM704_22035 [Anaeromyxobacteraceae bacterium]
MDGKNARARYWLVLTCRTLKTTFELLRVQLESYCDRCTKFTRAVPSQAEVALFIAFTTAAYRLPKLELETQ